MTRFATSAARRMATPSICMARFCVACFLPLCARPTSAQPADPRTPSRITIPEVTSPGIDANALKPVEEDGLPATVTKRRLRLAALIARLRAKEVSPQSAWQAGDLSLDDLLYVLNTPALLDASLENEPVRLGLAGLLTEHLPAALKNVELKRWAAYYFASVADARAVPLLEELLDAIKQPAPSEAAAERSMYLLMRLSSYYDKTGDPAKAADTLLRAEGYAQGFKMPTGAGGRAVPIAGMAANRLLDAAQLYQRASQPEKARELYARIAKYGYGWATGVAMLDQAAALTEQGKHHEARRLLQQPVTGRYADQVRVAMLSTLGDSYYRAGEFEEAQKYFQASIEQYKALTNPLRGDGLEGAVATSENSLRWIERWKKEPIIIGPQRLNIVVNQGLKSDAPIMRRLAVRTVRRMPLRVTTNNPLVRAWIEDEHAASRAEIIRSSPAPPKYFVEQKLVVEVSSQVLRTGLDAIVSISGEIPDFTTRVPIHVQALGEVAATKPKVEEVVVKPK